MNLNYLWPSTEQVYVQVYESILYTTSTSYMLQPLVWSSSVGGGDITSDKYVVIYSFLGNSPASEI